LLQDAVLLEGSGNVHLHCVFTYDFALHDTLQENPQDWTHPPHLPNQIFAVMFAMSQQQFQPLTIFKPQLKGLNENFSK
jgi:hypothetical protein